MSCPRGIVAAAALIAAALVNSGPIATTAAAQSDLDAFMQQVLARRDDNWKKLQQYILDEREEIELRGRRGAGCGANGATTRGTSAMDFLCGVR